MNTSTTASSNEVANTSKEEMEMEHNNTDNVIASPATGETPVAEIKTEGVGTMKYEESLMEIKKEELILMGETFEEEEEEEVIVGAINMLKIEPATKEDPMHLNLYEDALRYVLKQPGFKGTSKMKEALLAATKESQNNLIAFLRNPEDFGIAKSSITKYITPILDAVKIPKKKFSRAKFDQFLTIQFSFDDVKVSKDLNYLYVDATYGRRSQSHTLEAVAKGRQIRTTQRNSAGHEVVRYMWDARDMVYAQASEKSANLYAMILKGEKKLYVREPLSGKYIAFEPAIRSASNKRQMQGTLIKSTKEKFGARIELLKEIGSHPSTLGFIVDATKDRSGLNNSNSLGTGLYMGTQVVDESGKYGSNAYGIIGGDFNALVVKDVSSLVNQGKYQVFDLKQKKLVTLDAAEHPIKQMVSDGAAICGMSIYHILSSVFSGKISGSQFRLAPACKGMLICIPDFEEHFPGYDLLMFESAVKVDIRQYLKAFPVMNELRVMNPSMRKKEEIREASYQVGHAVMMPEEKYLEIADPIYDKYSNVAINPKSIHSLLNKENSTEMHTLLDKFLKESDLAQYDPYIARSAIRESKTALKRLRGGKLPMVAQFKFAMNDVYAMIDAILDNTYMIAPDKGLKGNTALTLRKGKLMPAGENFASARLPLQSLGEGAGLIAPEHEDIDPRYKRAIAMNLGFFEGFVIFSAHDFLAQKQGGLDYDGDLVMVIFGDDFVAFIFKTQEKYHVVLDFSIDENGVLKAGCPWEEKGIKPEKDYNGVNGVIKQNGFKLEVSEWTEEAVIAFLEMQDAYDCRTLQKNMIGTYTDYATMLHDALRQISFETRVAMHKGDLELVDKLKVEAITIIGWIGYLRLVQGYEIDRPKKGGAFEKELQEQLKFITDPGALAYRLGKWMTTETGERYFKWIRPNWMKNGDKNKNGRSVFGSLYQNVTKRLKQLDKDTSVLMSRLQQENTVLTGLSEAIPMDEVLYAGFKNLVNPIRKVYNAKIQKIVEFEQLLLKQNFNKLEDTKGMSLEDVELTEEQEKEVTSRYVMMFEYFSGKMDEAFEICANAGITKVQFGYFTYKLTHESSFRGDKKYTTEGSSFPFRAAGEYLYEALMFAEDKEAKPDLLTVFKGRRVSVRCARISNVGVLSERMNGQVAMLEVLEDGTFIEFQNGVRVQLFRDHLHKVAGYTGKVKVETVTIPTNKAKSTVNKVELGLILG